MGRIRVLVADGHRIFAEALATALAAEPDVEVAAAGSAGAAERALERAAGESRAFQVMLVDADLGAGPSAPHVPAQRRPPSASAPPAVPALTPAPAAKQADGIALI